MSKSTIWSDEDLLSLYTQKSNGESYYDIADSLGKTWQSCAGKYTQFDWESFLTKMSNKKSTIKSKKTQAEQFEIRKQQFVYKIQNAKQKANNKKNIMMQVIADRFQNAVKALPTVKYPININKKVKKDQSESEQMGLMLSDVHIGSSFTLQQTGGLAEFNTQIAISRLKNLTQATVDIYNLHSKLYKIPTLNIFSLGDIVAGANSTGAWSPVYINESVIDQMTIGFQSIAQMINQWLKVFETIQFWGVSGNHGRVAKSGVQKEYANWDYLCHKFLQARFSSNKRVHFNLPKSWWQMAKIKNHKFLLVHGEDVKAGGSPIAGLKNLQQKMIGVTRQIPDYTLAGHFHTSSELRTNSGKVILNGSVVGPDVYSLKNLQSSSKPQQKLFGVNSKYGITYMYDIRLDVNR